MRVRFLETLTVSMAGHQDTTSLSIQQAGMAGPQINNLAAARLDCLHSEGGESRVRAVAELQVSTGSFLLLLLGQNWRRGGLL